MKKHLFKMKNRKLHIALAGCGGTGCQMMTALARMDLALRNLGGDGLTVTAYDPDQVSAANAGRQSFYFCDIGKNKAEVLAVRHRLCFPGFAVEAHNGKYDNDNMNDLLITCVDSRSARREIFSMRQKDSYHIDCGNGSDHGQVIFGNGSKNLPYPEKVLPDLIAEGPEDDTPSCSMAEALEKQDLFVNDFAVRIAAAILWDLFRYGGTDIRGAFYSLNPVQVNPIKI